ncbi:hypothetical protein Trydic_g4742 [Trypoxylus dichotomus]
MFARTFSLEYVVLWRILLVCVSLSGITRAINYKKRAIITDKEQEYLMKFGYLSSNVEGAGALRTEESVKQALRNLQKFARLPVTGELDERTIELMSMPRCGVKDFGTTTGNGNGGAAVRRKRYVLHTGHPWQHTDLTWRVEEQSFDNNGNIRYDNCLITQISTSTISTTIQTFIQIHQFIAVQRHRGTILAAPHLIGIIPIKLVRTIFATAMMVVVVLESGGSQGPRSSCPASRPLQHSPSTHN